MSVTHPIGDEILLGYAAGGLPAVYDLLAACAVSLDDDARVRLGVFEAMGGALLAREQIAPLRHDSFEGVLRRIGGLPPEETVDPGRKVPMPDAVLPRPLRERLGGDAADLLWTSCGLGRREVALDHDVDGGGCLMAIPGGVVVPAVDEDRTALVLQGGFRIGADRYGRGDVVALRDPDHRAVAEDGPDCICLVVGDGSAPIPSLGRRLRDRLLAG
ncbi:hypothetical protein [Jannaschia sp. LMIT008]|uniref:hypothetical protein n=1 Tax=Jannaschia maritima TaxID=3032585 RepID=UPI0028123447|nr:hypothetical protein [Jannaschia sp. LMIT008]